MINKKSFIAASVALALTACGGSDSSSDDSSAKITAIDGYLTNAELWIDEDDNLIIDGADRQSGNTDENGQFTLTAAEQKHAVFIKAIKDVTIDSVRGVVSEDFELSAPAGSTVANPMTNMVIKQMSADNTLTQADAEDKVIKAIQDSGLTASKALIFGDYLADTTDQQSQALNIIAESLVDNADKPIETQLKVAEEVAKKVKEQIVDDKILDSFYPTVSFVGDEISVVVNSRPVSNGSIDTQTIDFSNNLTEIEAASLFSDEDNDTLTYQLVSKTNSGLNGLTIDANTGIISGTPTLAGTFEYQVFAKDATTRSYPINFTVTVNADNTAPKVDSEVKTTLSDDIEDWGFTVGDKGEYTLDISSLFTDTESDPLTYTFKLSGNNPLTTSVDNNGTLTINGTPNEAGSVTLTVEASDGTHEKVASEFTFDIAESLIPSESINTLIGQKWYYTEVGTSDGGTESGNERVWCDTILFDGGIVYLNDRTPSNRTECSDEATKQIGTYTVNELGQLETTYSFTEGGEDIQESGTLTVQQTEGTITDAILVRNITESPESEKNNELYTYFSTATAAEKRITIQSNAGPAVRDVDVYLPSEQSESWKKGVISVSLGKFNKSENDDVDPEYLETLPEELYDADITFSLAGEVITCESLTELFDNFVITSNNRKVESYYNCYTNPYEGSATIDIDIYDNLTIGSVYSIIGYPKDGESEYTEAVKFNITWTGTGNNY